MSGTAKLLKVYFDNEESGGVLNNSCVYRLEPPFKNQSVVLVSEAKGILDGFESLHETMVFAATEDGRVTNWTDLHVIYEVSQEKCLADMGYKIVR